MASAGKEFFRKRYEQLGGKIVPVSRPQTIRVNTLKTTAKNIIARLEKLGVQLERVPYTKYGYRVMKSKFSLSAITEHLLGYYYLQGAAAQLPVQVLNPRETDTVLDCCAAPGGKTTQIAAHMNNKGTIISYELKQHRIRSLVTNLERCGITNATVFQKNVTKAGELNMEFDKALVDAPCSGNYVTDSTWFEKRDQEGIERSKQIQRNIIKAAVDQLKPGGILVYSTCSLEPEENELNMQWAIDTLPVKLAQVTLPLGDDGLTNIFGRELHKDIALCKRFWPHKTETEGFFIAKLVKI